MESRSDASDRPFADAPRASAGFSNVARLACCVLLAAVLTGCRDSDAPSASAPASNSPSVVADGANAPSAGGAAPVDSPAAPPFQFVESARAAGVDWTYRNGEEAGHAAILESLGGGVAVCDYDRDGRLDLWFTGGGGLLDDLRTTGLPSGLFRNRGERKFQPTTSAARVDAARRYSHGAFSADYDADGFPDLLVTGYGGLTLWKNQGDGTFVEQAAEAGLNDERWSSSAAWADFDADGHLDLFVVHYVNWSASNHPRCELSGTMKREVCPPRIFEGLPVLLYRSRGDGTFADATAESGVEAVGKGLGVVVGDVDQDGDADVYVGNDTVDNFLFVNDGSGRFKETGLIAGVATNDRGVPDGSMGVDMLDYNLDGRPDLWAANYEQEAFALYRNEGGGQFLHVSRSNGITAIGGLFVGFGTAWCDYDRDGDEDVLVANGHVIKYPTSAPRRQQPLALENREGRFHRATYAADNYFQQSWEARGLAVGDLDDDGRIDCVVSHINEPSAVLFNETPAQGDWIGVRLVGRRSNRDGIGATVRLDTSAGPRIRLVKGGGSYLSQSDYAAFWGLPEGVRAERLTVRWPSGAEQSVAPTTGRWTTVVEADAPDA